MTWISAANKVHFLKAPNKCFLSLLYFLLTFTIGSMPLPISKPRCLLFRMTTVVWILIFHTSFLNKIMGTWRKKKELHCNTILGLQISYLLFTFSHCRKQHPYEVPEVISMKVMTEWIAHLTRLTCFLFILYSNILRL